MDRLRRARLWIAFEFVLAGSLIVPVIGHAQVSPTDEYKELVTSAQDVTALGAHPFGERVDLDSGALSFEVTDISVPGTGPALTLGRSLNTAEDSQDAVDAITGAGGFWRPFGDWDLSVPRIETNAAWQMGVEGWVVGVNSNKRCTGFGVPPPVPSTSPPDSDWQPERWWYGYHLIVPGVGEQTLLASYDGQTPTDGKAYSIGTKQNWVITCGVAASDGGEGFLATAPDGTRYTFAHLVYRPMPWISRPTGSTGDVVGSVHPMMNDADYLARYDAAMYVTQIEDRFGNTITYNWSGNNLTSIVASDGREIDLTYKSGTPFIETATEKAFNGAPTRTWTYTYGGTSAVPTLTNVQLPDDHAWSYQIGNLESATLNTLGGTCTALPSLSSGAATGSMISPSGLTASFTITPIVHGRSYVPQVCWSPYAGSQTTYANIPDEYYQFSLTKEVLTGLGIPTETWTWSYSPPNQSWTSDPCAASQTCSTTVYTDVTDPLGHDVRYTFSNRFDASESLLLRTDDYSGAAESTTLRSEVNTYANPTGGPWPSSYGTPLQPRTNHAQIEEVSPLQKRVVSQDGATFTTDVNSFDAFAHVTSQTESSSLDYSKTDTTTYQNDTNLWVLGLVTQTATSGIVDSQISYDSHDMPTIEKSFGRVVSTKTWNYAAGQGGTLANIVDGDGHTTTFSSWYRGVPEKITYADSHSQSATVNGDGWITSVTDENGYSTTYAYDAMGRLASIAYPAETGVTWNSTNLSFTPKGTGEYNTPVGAWVQTVQTGNEITNTYFDAFWRPLVTEHYDAGDKGDTLSQTITHYDAAGRTIFTSYPTDNVQDYTTANIGSHTTYDALNRVIEVDQDWDLDSTGLLATKTTYLPGFKTEVTLPNGPNTAITTSYMAYGSPTMQWPVSISAPDSELTTIHRDVFGKPLSITRNGTSCETSSSSLCRSFAYNAYQQLCGRTEPETGTTMYGYDRAGNLTWSVPGLPATAGCYTDTQAQNSGQMVSRTYDGRNRLTDVTYPDGFSTATYQYTPDGALQMQSVANDSFPVTTYYSYDERRLLTSEKLCFSAPPCASNAPTFALGYGYDANGHLSSTTYPDGRGISYAPNALGQPTAAGSYATSVKYFPNGTMASFNYGSGAKYTASEDERGLVSRDTDALNGAAAMDFSYDYDPDGNVAAITDYLSGNLGNVDMTYDELDRLKEADSPMFGGTVANPGKALYGYDVFDNLTSASVGNQSLFNYVYNYAQDQLAKLTDPSSGTPLVTYAYDAQGNLAQKNAQVYKFDMANRLMSVPSLATYRYDAAGRRVQKVETEAGKTLDSDYSRAGNLMYQWDLATANSTDYVYLGSTLIARVVGNNSKVIGNIDGIPTAANPVVGGWACSTGIAGSITVQLYVGGPWNGDDGSKGTLVATTTANLPSEAAVASSCGTNGTNYRFSIPISAAIESQYPNEPIWVYGVSPIGSGISALTNSGAYTVPANPAAPEPPASISVPSTNVGGSYTVSWSASSGATSYVLQQESNIMPTWEQVYSGTSTSTSVSVGSMEFRYQVQACNANGCSSFSTPSSWVTVLPAAPASISVPSSSYSASIPVSWAASSIATNYVLEERENGGSWGEAWSGGTTSTTATVSSTGSYQFQIAACGEAGCSGFTSSGNVAVTLPPAAAPSLSGPSASSTGSFTLGWSAVAGASRYQLNQNFNGTVTVPYNSTGTSWSSSNFGNGTYNYQVFACNVAGCSPGSAITSVVVTHPPASAPSLSGPSSSSTGTYTLTWSTVSTATRYQLNQSVNGGAASAVYNSTGTSWSSNAVGNGSYAYVVYACNVGGCSPASSTVTVTVLHPPAAPTLSGPSSSASGTFKLTWTSAPTATSYHLHQSVNGGASSLIYVTAGNSWSSSNLGNGSYAYSVCADNAAGCGPSSNTVTVSVLHVPAVPANMTAPSSVPYPGNPWSISIAASSGATSYNLRRTDTATGAATVKSGVGTSTTDYTTPGTYQYAAQACNASGCSGWRNAGNTTNVFCAESAATMTRGSVSPDILKCGGTL